MFELLLQLVCLYVVVRLVVGFFSAWNEAKQEVHDQLMKTLDEITHVVSVEQHGEQTYWYDAATDSFIAQGKTLDDIISVVKSRFPTHFFFLENNEQIYKLSGPDWKMELHRVE